MIEDHARVSAEAIQRLANQLGKIFASPIGNTWIRVRYLPLIDYAENDCPVDDDCRPTFVTVLRAKLPDRETLRSEAQSIAQTVASVLERPERNTHVLYEPEASGRIALAGVLREM